MIDFKNKKVVIMGLGNYKEGSGIAAARFFARQGARVLVTDMKPKANFAGQLKSLAAYRNIRYVFGGHREADFKNADSIIKNPAVPKNSPYLAVAKKHGVPVHNDWSIFLSVSDMPVIGVTGTKGKTTTATLLNEFLKERHQTMLCGNMGISPLATLHKAKKESIAVAELSSWNLQQLPTVKKSPYIAVVTNLFPEHLNKYNNLAAYYKDKDVIWKYQTPHNFLVANRDNAALRKRIRKAKSRIFWFSQKPFVGDGVHVKNGRIFFRYDKVAIEVCKVKDIRLKGGHNVENVCAAVCAAMIAHVSPAHIRKILRAFTGVPNRLELVRVIGGVAYYNDTAATMPDATIAALRALDSKRVILFAGGADKKLHYGAFVKEIKKYGPRLIFFSGAATDKMLKELKNYSHILGEVRTMHHAMRLARAHAKKGDTVLLSPGAASFGIFKNEFDRGAQFIKEVHLLHKREVIR